MQGFQVQNIHQIEQKQQLEDGYEHSEYDIHGEGGSANCEPWSYDSTWWPSSHHAWWHFANFKVLTFQSFMGQNTSNSRFVDTKIPHQVLILLLSSTERAKRVY
jgi:hypothetical protein